MGPVELAIRAGLAPPVALATPAQDKPFTVEAFNDRGMVLLLGKQEARTPISWPCLEGIIEYLRGRSWVRLGSKFEVDADPDTLDAYLKTCIKRATAAWVAAVLEAAGVVEIRRERPVTARLSRGF